MYKQYYIKTDSNGSIVSYSKNEAAEHDITVMAEEGKVEQAVRDYQDGWIEISTPIN